MASNGDENGAVRRSGLRPLVAASVCVIVAFLVWVLVQGSALLTPLVFAIFIWFLINVLAHVFEGVPLAGRHLPRAVCFILSFAVIAAVVTFFVQIIMDNVFAVVREVPTYQEKLLGLVQRVFAFFGEEEPPTIRQLVIGLDLPSMGRNFAFAVTSMVGNAGLIIVYLIFLFIEQKSFAVKISRLAKTEGQKRDIMRTIERIGSDIRKYIGIKTLTSTVTAIASYAIFRAVDLDFPMFWALLIFLFNFIPTIGSIVATIFPSLLSLIQFDTFGPFFVVAIGVTAIQLAVGNFFEPRLMGKTLNLSPLIILLSLALWGKLWGIPGMFLCVPLTVIIMIILSNFDSTRPIVVLLSGNGEVETGELSGKG